MTYSNYSQARANTLRRAQKPICRCYRMWVVLLVFLVAVIWVCQWVDNHAAMATDDYMSHMETGRIERQIKADRCKEYPETCGVVATGATEQALAMKGEW